jgi:DNA-binding MarR family transcriptional regulator
LAGPRIVATDKEVLVDAEKDHAGYDPPHRLQQLPSWLASEVARRAHRLVADAVAEEGVRRPHFTVLTALSEGGAASQMALGTRLAIDRSDLNAILNELEAAGLVERVRDETDRRRNLVRLTPGGVVALRRLDARIDGAQDALLTPLSATERRELVRLLKRVVEHHPV